MHELSVTLVHKEREIYKERDGYIVSNNLPANTLVFQSQMNLVEEDDMEQIQRQYCHHESYSKPWPDE
jgi:hypothetical protein